MSFENTQISNAICDNAPLDTGQYGSHIVRRTPPILQNIQAKFPRSVDIWVEHLANELDTWRFVWILFFKMHDQTKRSIFEGCICRSDNDSVPGWLCE